jgi:hypothetical protein
MVSRIAAYILDPCVCEEADHFNLSGDAEDVMRIVSIIDCYADDPGDTDDCYNTNGW